MKKRLFTCVALLLAAVMLLSACGSDAEQQQGQIILFAAGYLSNLHAILPKNRAVALCPSGFLRGAQPAERLILCAAARHPF